MSNPQEYFSFLICSRSHIVQLYFNGRPIGEIKGNSFQAHEFTLLDGSKKTITINEITEPFPFKDIEELKSYLIEAIQSIKLAEIPEPAKG
jgi:hypothetical protein